ncbi:MAG TPA: hypothetical protein VIM11_15760 [Tepidisphaeraceae bacterium]|jgi:hypothetical protein
MAEDEYRKIADGQVLKKLGSGLEIVRRKKHEWTPELGSLSGEPLRRITDKIHGSKFLPQWNLVFYVQWIEEQLTLLGWDRHTGPGSHTIDLADPVGYSNGKAVRRITIVLSSRVVHAYPVES